MNTYCIVFTRTDGTCDEMYVDEMYVDAANELAALHVFDSFGFENVVSISVFEVDEEDYKEN